MRMTAGLTVEKTSGKHVSMIIYIYLFIHIPIKTICEVILTFFIQADPKTTILTLTTG